MKNQKKVIHHSFPPSLLALAISTATITPVSASLLDEELAGINVVQMQGDQTLSGYDVVELPNNQFAVVWATRNNSANDQIVLQRYSHLGETVGEQVVIYDNPSSENSFLNRPQIAADNTGKMVIGWEVRPQSDQAFAACNSAKNIMVVTMDSANTPTAVSFPGTVNLTDSCGVGVGMDDDGDFVVSWATRKAYGNLDVQLMTFTALGQPLSAEISLATGVEVFPFVAMQSNGSFMATWPETGSNGKRLMMARRFANINAASAGSAFRLDNNATRDITYQYRADISADKDGGFVAIWTEHQYATFSGLIGDIDYRGQRWAADGTPGTAYHFSGKHTNSGSSGFTEPSIDADSEGNFMAAWTYGQNNSGEPTKSVNEVTGYQRADNTPLGVVSLGDGSLMASFAGAKVALNDESAITVWTEQGSAQNAVLQARFSPGLPAGGNSNSGGGSIAGWSLILAGLLGLWRRFSLGLTGLGTSTTRNR